MSRWTTLQKKLALAVAAAFMPKTVTLQPSELMITADLQNGASGGQIGDLQIGELMQRASRGRQSRIGRETYTLDINDQEPKRRYLTHGVVPPESEGGISARVPAHLEKGPFGRGNKL